MGLGDRIAVHGPRPGAPARPAGRGLRRPGRHLRGHLHRLPADEPGAPRRPPRRVPPRAPAAGRARRRARAKVGAVQGGPDRVPLRRPARVRHGHAHRRGDPGHRPAAGHGRDPDRGRRDVRVRRAPPTGCGSSTPKAGTGPTPSRSEAEAMDAATTERPGVRAGRRPARHFADNERQMAIWFLLPSIVYMVALVAVPFFLAIGFAFSDVTAGDPSFDWAGLRNFERAFDDPVFWRSLRNTFVFTVRLDGPDRGPRQGPGQHPGRRLPRQVAGPVPGPAALDDPGGPVGGGLAVDARLGLQPDRLGAAPAGPDRRQHLLAGPAATWPWRR